MRLGLVCPYDLSKPGGVQAQVKDLARQLQSQGDEVLVFAPGLPDAVHGVDLGATLSIPGNRSKVPLSLDASVGRKIRDAGSGVVDLLHIHEPLMPLVSLSALRAGIPVVATFHASPGTFGIGFYTVLRSQISRLLGPNVRAVTAVSRAAAAPLPRELGAIIVPNGVDVDAFQVDVERAPQRIAFLGRDERRKGLDVLLEAWGRVSKSFPDAELVVMGADRGTPGVEWLGTVDDSRKQRGLASAAICVAPNLGGESFGIVLVEAMAAGAAVVASDLDSFQEVGGDAVRYFSTGDSSALAGVLSDLLSEPAVVEKMSAAGRERAGLYDWGRVAASYRSVYEKALS